LLRFFSHSALGQTREAAMKDFQFLITPYQGVDKRLQNLKCILRDHFSSPDAEDRKFVENFIHYTGKYYSLKSEWGPKYILKTFR